MRNRFILFLMSIVGTGYIFAQQDPIIFEVNDNEVLLSEFKYIYEKTGTADIDYTKESVMDYLNLYTNFKLKVAEAYRLKYDTIKALQEELEGYKKQLSKNYLLDKEILENLAREAYERQQNDVKLAHIFVQKIHSNDRAAKNRIEKALSELKAGKNFGDVAKSFSEDPSNKDNGGVLGWRNVLFPNGFYELEETAYRLEVGETSSIVESRAGFHILKLLDKRPAVGQIKVAHILLRKPVSGDDSAEKLKIDSIYQELKYGANWEEMVANHSEDTKTVNNGGQLPLFGVNTYEAIFEDAAFGLREDGEISKPIETEAGWHIIKRISVDPVDHFSMEKRGLIAEIKNNERFKVAESALAERLKEDLDYTLLEFDVEEVEEAMGGEELYEYSWKKPQEDLSQYKLFRIEDKVYDAQEYVDYLVANSSLRARMRGLPSPNDLFLKMMDEYVKSELISIEESKLEEKYPDFKALMREYREGILLFEIQKEKVWDKAIEDSVGLKNYYSDHRERYMTSPEYTIEKFTINTTNVLTLAKFMKMLEKKGAEKAMDKFNNAADVVGMEMEIVSESELESLGLKSNKGAVSKPMEIGDGKSVVYKVKEISEPQPRAFNEARGSAIVDYQNFLEQQWLEELKSKHSVVSYPENLNSLIK